MLLVDFNNLINECLNNFFAIGNTLVCKPNVVKFVVSLTSLILKLVKKENKSILVSQHQFARRI